VRGGSVKLSETLNDFLHDLDSAEGWAESDRHDRELAADFEAFTLPSRALITSILRKYRRIIWRIRLIATTFERS
jgi:hypothetical protein